MLPLTLQNGLNNSYGPVTDTASYITQTSATTVVGMRCNYMIIMKIKFILDSRTNCCYMLGVAVN